MYKSLFQGGHFSHSTKSVIHLLSFSPSAFASAFMVTVSNDVTVNMAGGEGAFVVAEFLQQIMEEGSTQERHTVKNWFDKGVVDSIKKSEMKGRNILLEKINALCP
jgi:pumilio family protein 6